MTVLAENTMLGPYRIAALIGEGGMGAVYRARDTRLGREVAVKVLTNVTLNDRERLTRFAQEARATGQLSHPNLLTIFDIGQTGGIPYIVSEFLEGENLRERLSRGPLQQRKAVEIASGMAGGLAAAHDKGIIHRDLKPENIYLTRDGRVKILDFGIAKLSAGKDEGPFRSAATEPGMVLGTVGYMSPEQVRGENLDQRSDIFAFGAILYEMLTGARAFRRDSSVETLAAILKDEPPEMTTTMTGIAPPLERLVRRCLEKDRAQRFQSARDLAFNLETLHTMSSAGPQSRPADASGRPAMTAGTAARRPTAPSVPGAETPTMRVASSGTHAAPAAPAPEAPIETRSMKARPAPVPAAAPRRISPILLGTLIFALLVGAAYGGWYFAQRIETAKNETTFRRLTFRRGEVRSARFTPDGETIVYSAAWEGRPSDVFVASRISPDARSLGIADADVLSVSKLAEVAILLRRDRFSGLGTLARVPLAGGVPREVSTGASQADWTPDGSSIAVIRANETGYWVEFPIGTPKYRTPHYIRDVRVSPDGKRVAFIEPHGGANDIVIAGDGPPRAIARGWSRGATGLSWSPDGNEVWITGTDTSAPPSLWAVPLDGEPRLVDRLTGSMKLFDISAQRQVLLANGTWRAALMYSAPRANREQDLSWLDWSILADLSADGKTLVFNETREGGGAAGSVYLRASDEPVPVRIGDGYGDAISPDKKWVLSHSGPKLVLLPTGAGDPRMLKVEGSFELGAAWLPDSRRVVVGGAPPNGKYRLMILDTAAETATPISPEDIWNNAIRPFAVSPDGHWVAGMSTEETIRLYPTDGSLKALRVPGVEKGEVPIQFTGDGEELFVYQPTALPARIYRVRVAEGTRQLWKEFAPSDPAGVYRISPVLVTPDANSWAYNALRQLSDLYVADGLE